MKMFNSNCERSKYIELDQKQNVVFFIVSKTIAGSQYELV